MFQQRQAWIGIGIHKYQAVPHAATDSRQARTIGNNFAAEDFFVTDQSVFAVESEFPTMKVALKPAGRIGAAEVRVNQPITAVGANIVERLDCLCAPSDTH